MSTSKQTHDHQEIKNWAKERGGVPAKVKGTGKSDDDGVLRIHFPKHSENNSDLEEIEWEDFFKEFDGSKLDLLYQDKKLMAKKVPSISLLKEMVNTTSLFFEQYIYNIYDSS